MNKQIAFFCLQLLVFSMPLVPRLIPLLLIAFCVIRLFKKGITFPRDASNRLSILFWIMGLASLCYTNDLDQGKDEMIRLLPLILFPLFLPALRFTRNDITEILGSFIAGNVIAVFLSLFNSGYMYYLTGDSSQFFYTNFSKVLHPSYLSLYLMTCIIALFHFEGGVFRNRALKVAILALFSIGIILCSSRIAIIILILFYIWLFISLIRSGEYRLNKLIVLSTIVLVSAFLFFSKSSERFVSLLNPTKNVQEEDKSLARKSIWIASLKGSIAVFPFGTGIGGERAAVSEKLLESRHIDLADRNLNSHNQFLDALLSLGVIGFLCLVALFISHIIRSINESDYFSLGFLIACVLNLLFESMLYRQEGVVFISFFLVFSSLFNGKFNRKEYFVSLL